MKSFLIYVFVIINFANLDSTSFKQREIATKNLCDIVVISYPYLRDTHVESPEVRHRMRAIRIHYNRKTFDYQLNALGEIPWIDCLPTDSPQYHKISYYMDMSEKQGHSYNNPKAEYIEDYFPVYKEAMRMMVKNMIMRGDSFENVKTLVDKTRENSKNWIKENRNLSGYKDLKSRSLCTQQNK